MTEEKDMSMTEYYKAEIEQMKAQGLSDSEIENRLNEMVNRCNIVFLAAI